MLTDREYTALPAAAREHYDLGTFALDHIDYREALRQYRVASELAPDSAALQLKVVELSRRQARLESSRRAEDFLVIGLEALQRILDSPVSSPDDQQRAQRLMEDIRNTLEEVPGREQRRIEMGREFIHALTLERDWRQARREGGEMKPLVATEPGPGSILLRSVVLLEDAQGRLYNPDKTEFKRDGENMTRGLLSGWTFEDSPGGSFFQGVDPAAIPSISPFSADSMAMPQTSAANDAGMQDFFSDDGSMEDDSGAMMEDEADSTGTADWNVDFSDFFSDDSTDQMSTDDEAGEPSMMEDANASLPAATDTSTTSMEMQFSEDEMAEMERMIAEAQAALSQEMPEGVPDLDPAAMSEEDLEAIRQAFATAGIEGDPAAMTPAELQEGLRQVVESMANEMPTQSEPMMEMGSEPADGAAQDTPVDPFAGTAPSDPAADTTENPFL
jgi:hypothetical protein